MIVLMINKRVAFSAARLIKLEKPWTSELDFAMPRSRSEVSAPIPTISIAAEAAIAMPF
jgi:hypothetical protein